MKRGKRKHIKRYGYNISVVALAHWEIKIANMLVFLQI